MEGPHGILCEVRCHGLETNALGAIGQGFADFVGCEFPLTADVARILEEIAVKLEHDSIRERNVGVVLVDRIENVAVAGDFPFRAILGFGAGGDEFAQALVVRSDDAF